MDQARRRLPFDRPATVLSTSTIPSKVFSTSPERRYTPSTSTPSSSPTTASSSPPPTSPYFSTPYNPIPPARHTSSKAAPPPTHGRDTILIRRHQSPGEILHARDPSDRRTRHSWEEDAQSYAYARTQSAFASSSSMPSSPTRLYSSEARSSHGVLQYDEYPQRKRVLQRVAQEQPYKNPVIHRHHPHHRNDHQRLHGSSTDRARSATHSHHSHRAGPFMHTVPSQSYHEGHPRNSHSPASRPSTLLSADHISRSYSSSSYGPIRPTHEHVFSALANDDMDMDVDIAFPPALDEFLPHSSLDDAVDDQSEGDDDKVVLFASPRRRVSFSTSNERDTPLPPRLPSLFATIKSQGRIPAQMEDKVGLPTPPASEPSETPERDRDVLPGTHRESVLERTAVRGTDGRVTPNDEQGHRRTRSRPTLMDLLSGPACPPSSPVKEATVGVESGDARIDSPKGDPVVNVEVHMLPTPEDEVAPGSPLKACYPLSESSDLDTALPDRASAVPSTVIGDSPLRQSSPLPPSSPPQYSSPLKDASSTVASPVSSPFKDSLPPSSPMPSSSSQAFTLTSPLLYRRMSTPPAPLKRCTTPPLRQRTRTPATPELSYGESANDLLSSPLSPEPIPDDEAETATFVGTPDQAQMDMNIESQGEDSVDDLPHSMSSPLSPAPSSRASSVPAPTARGVKRVADDVLPTLPPIKRARVQRKTTPVYTDESESENDVIQTPAPKKSRRKLVSEDQSEDEALTESRATKKGKRAQRSNDDGAPVRKARTQKVPSRDSDDEEDAHAQPRTKKKRTKAVKSREVVESDSDTEVQADTKLPAGLRASSSSTRSSSPPHSRQPSPPLRHSTPPDPRPQGRRTRGRKKSAGGDATAWRALENVDWNAEAPVPLPELEGMIIETLATARATSMSGQSILSVLMNRDNVRNRTRRRHLRSEDTDAPQEDGEGAEMDKIAWLHVLTHVLTTGHLGSGVFGRVDSSASDSDAPPSPPNSPAKPRMRLSHRAAQLAQWYYVPEKDADKERAGVVKSMMRGPGKRTETKKYKQYYWRPLGKISRWDPEDDL